MYQPYSANFGYQRNNEHSLQVKIVTVSYCLSGEDIVCGAFILSLSQKIMTSPLFHTGVDEFLLQPVAMPMVRIPINSRTYFVILEGKQSATFPRSYLCHRVSSASTLHQTTCPNSKHLQTKNQIWLY